MTSQQPLVSAKFSSFLRRIKEFERRLNLRPKIESWIFIYIFVYYKLEKGKKFFLKHQSQNLPQNKYKL
jgi:hypothetical protein